MNKMCYGSKVFRHSTQYKFTIRNADWYFRIVMQSKEAPPMWDMRKRILTKTFVFPFPLRFDGKRDQIQLEVNEYGMDDSLQWTLVTSGKWIKGVEYSEKADNVDWEIIKSKL